MGWLSAIRSDSREICGISCAGGRSTRVKGVGDFVVAEPRTAHHGPCSMMDAVTAMLRALRVPQSSIHSEQFAEPDLHARIARASPSGVIREYLSGPQIR